MTPEKALKIVGREAPCPHDSWQIVGTGTSVRCEDCGQNLVYDREKGEPVRSETHVQYLEALDVLAEAVAVAQQQSKTKALQLTGQGLEVHVIVGDDPYCFWKVHPYDGNEGVAVSFCVRKGDSVCESTAAGWPAELSPKMVQAINLVTQYLQDS